jgi:Tfp pilus assembly protein PilV
MKTTLLKNQSGFGLIEIVITSTIIVVSFTAFLSFILFSRNATFKAQRNTEAVAAGEEAMEVVRKLKDDNWTSNIASLTAGTTYYPKLTGTTWSLTTTNPNTSSYYTTTIVFSNVSRDGSFNIVTSGGSNDTNSKKVVVTVTWKDSGTKTVKLTGYIGNIKNN